MFFLYYYYYYYYRENVVKETNLAFDVDFDLPVIFITENVRNYSFFP